MRDSRPGRARWAIAAAAVLLPLLLVDFLSTESTPHDRFDRVVVDAGHGGSDRGARGARGLVEKDLVLDVSLRLAQRLRRQGLGVVLTRVADEDLSLEERRAFANAARADLFVSIHANAAGDPAVRGVETYFLSLDASDEAAQQVALRENLALRRRSLPARPSRDPLLAIMSDLIVSKYLEQSNEFARLAHAELAAAAGGPSRGVRQAPFTVLMGLQMPASLVEIGFLTHAGEERALASSRQRERLAEALARAVARFGRRRRAG